VDNTIVLDSSQVSRYHAKITILPDGAVIEDSGSTNGTFVNGQRITSQYRLSSGDSIGIANYITYQYVVESVRAVSPQPGAKGSTQVFGTPGDYGPAQTPSPEIRTYTPEFQSSTYAPVVTSAVPPNPVNESISKKNPTALYFIIALLVVLICICIAAAIFLWFAPEAFWRDFFDFFGIPWPSQPMLLLNW
jgi:pSer/pThr/pTyr-binding forkhead associated (FHA) protein